MDDILTIVVSENINASKNSAADAGRTGSATSILGVVPKLISGLISSDQEADASGQNVMSAKGGANSRVAFNDVITVPWWKCWPTSNLLVSGEKLC